MRYCIPINKILVLFLLIAASACSVKKKNTLQGNNEKTNILPAWALGGFVRQASNPIIIADSSSEFIDPVTGERIRWESNDTFNPGAVEKDGKIVLLYRAEDKYGVKIGRRTSRLGYAISTDGISFKKNAAPVLYPAEDDQKEYEWPGGCEDPRVAVTEDSTYIVIYTQWNRDVPRLGIASSKDLIHWVKHGPIFKHATKGILFNTANKSGSIVTKLAGDKLVIAKVNGKYLMYWGEKGVYLATSDNLFDWEPLIGEDGKPKPLISPRIGFFDSDLTECGPPALITEKGILLLYNGKNNGSGKGDKRFVDDSYSAGQVLFDKNNPEKVIGRLNVPFLRPMEAFEKSGQYIQGTVFIEGLVHFRQKWFLYYGCADSKVAVAVYDPLNPTSPDPLFVDVPTGFLPNRLSSVKEATSKNPMPAQFY